MLRQSIVAFSVISLLALTLGAGCGGGSASTAQSTQPATGYGPATLDVNNLSNQPIYYVYMSPSNSQSWGPNLLGAQTLFVGQTFAITGVSAGYWDVRVVDSTGNYKEFYANYFEPGGFYWLDVSSDGWYF